MKEKFMKNGVFSLEYDKETLRDIVLELQEENKKAKKVIDKLNDLLSDEFLEVIDRDTLLDILKEVSE